MKNHTEQIAQPEALSDEDSYVAEEPLILSAGQELCRRAFLARTLGQIAAVRLAQTQDGEIEQYFAHVDELLVKPPENCPPLLPADKEPLMRMQGLLYLGLDYYDSFFYAGFSRAEYDRRFDQLATYIRVCHSIVPIPDHIVPRDELVAREGVVDARLRDMGVSDRDREIILLVQSGLKTRAELQEEHGLSRPGIGRILRDAVNKMAEKYGHHDPLTLDLATDLLPNSKKSRADGFTYPSRREKRAREKAEAKERTKTVAAKTAKRKKPPAEAGAPTMTKKGPAREKTKPTAEQKPPRLRLKAEEEVSLAQDIEAGLYADYKLKQSYVWSPEYAADLQALKEKGDQAFVHFVKANAGLVRSFIRRKRSKIEGGGITDIFSITDYVTEHGLEHAVRKFDYKLGFKFSTYAVSWIDRAIDRAVALHQPLTIGADVYGMMWRLVVHRRAVFAKTGQSISNAELADFFNISERRAADLLDTYARLKTTKSFQAPLRSDNSSEPRTKEEVTEDTKQSTQDDIVLRLDLEKGLEKLSDRERFVVEHSFGLNDRPVLETAEIAEWLGLSVSTVGNIKRKALHLLRASLADPEDA